MSEHRAKLLELLLNDDDKRDAGHAAQAAIEMAERVMGQAFAEIRRSNDVAIERMAQIAERSNARLYTLLSAGHVHPVDADSSRPGGRQRTPGGRVPPTSHASGAVRARPDTFQGQPDLPFEGPQRVPVSREEILGYTDRAAIQDRVNTFAPMPDVADEE